MTDDPVDHKKPTEMRGGAAPSGAEFEQKGDAAQAASKGIVPPELGGSDASPELQADEPELKDAVLGGAASDEPATEGGVDLGGGENADATTDGGAKPTPGEPDLKDAASGPRQVDTRSAE